MPCRRRPRPPAAQPHLGRAAVRTLVAAPVAGPPGPLSPRSARWCRCCCSWRRSSRRSGTCATRRSSARQESVKRDTEIAQQQIRLRLIENQEQLVRIARELVTRATRRATTSSARPRSFTRERPEITNLIWVGPARARAQGQPSGHELSAREPASTASRDAGSLPIENCRSEPEEAFKRGARHAPAGLLAALQGRLRQPGVPGRSAADRARRLQRRADRRVFGRRLLRYFVPAEVSRRHAISLLDQRPRRWRAP